MRKDAHKRNTEHNSKFREQPETFITIVTTMPAVKPSLVCCVCPLPQEKKLLRFPRNNKQNETNVEPIKRPSSQNTSFWTPTNFPFALLSSRPTKNKTGKHCEQLSSQGGNVNVTPILNGDVGIARILANQEPTFLFPFLSRLRQPPRFYRRLTRHEVEDGSNGHAKVDRVEEIGIRGSAVHPGHQLRGDEPLVSLQTHTTRVNQATQHRDATP